MKLLLARYPKSTASVMGQLYIDGVWVAYTLEPLNCIPTGTYDVELFFSDHWHAVIAVVMGVPGRSGIEIHIGNWPKDTTGCILPGKTKAVDEVGNSVEALEVIYSQILKVYNKEPIKITVQDSV